MVPNASRAPAGWFCDARRGGRRAREPTQIQGCRRGTRVADGDAMDLLPRAVSRAASLVVFALGLGACAAPPADEEVSQDEDALEGPASEARTAVFARGSVDVGVFTVLFPRARVAALLPDTLELGDLSSLGIAADVYPVLFVAGEQRGVHADFASLLTMTYDEAVVFVPNVRFVRGVDCVEGRTGGFLFSPAMYVSDVRPWLGTSGYRYPKRLEALRADERSFAVGTAPHERLAVTFGPSEALSAVGEANRARIAELASAPIIGTAKGDRRYAWSYFDWNLEAAEVTSLGVSGFVGDALGDGATLPLAFDRPGLNAAITGAFRLRTSWTLSRARRCSF